MTNPAAVAATEQRHRFLITLNFAAVYTLWGSTYLAIRFGVRDLPPALMAGARFTIAGALLLAWLRWRRVPLPPRSLFVPIAITGLLLMFGGNWLVTWAELTVPSGMAAVIVANLPFFVAGIEAVRPDGERLSPIGVLGLVIGFGGMLILMGPKLAGLGGGGRGLGDFKGELALLLANLCWAWGSIYARRRIRGIPPLMGAALEMLIAGLALTGTGLLLGEAPRFHLTRSAALALAWLIVAGSLCGYTAYIWLLHHVPAAKVSTYAYVNPIIAVVLGWLVLDEALDWRMAAGTAVILGGVAVVNTARVRARR
ncbi:MAG TPA: EamA family transporter [Candidatus Polarisedimenticolia bacterium]|jgi:drug/metabolite transporter (DMT)-like permease|nr:EamA family transporter [Candidatus Polarisedimenticolia bacterium]